MSLSKYDPLHIAISKCKRQKMKLDELRKLLEKEEENFQLLNEEVKQEIIKINNLKPTTAIFVQDEPSKYPNGETYDYDDTEFKNLIDFENQKTIIYEGQKFGRADRFIQLGALFFAREKRWHNYKYIGQVTFVREISKNKNPEPAKYELTLTRNIINNIRPLTSFEKVNNFSGPGCLKEAALFKMGFKLDKKRKGASLMGSLNAICKY